MKKPLKNEEFEKGFRFACDMVNEMYIRSSTHPYMIGDCLLAKVNKLPTKKVRKNPYVKTISKI